MTDIVDRLRKTPCNREPFTPSHAECQCRVANAAAAEIEKLRSVVVSALDCLHHDDAKLARKILAGEK